MKDISNTLIIDTKEEITQTELKAEDILKTKQLVPQNFVKLETKYFSTTLPSWPKSLCERYSFPQGEDWLFLDIPQGLMKELELEAGKEIPHPFYIASETLKRKPVCGGITLQNKEEMFLLKPLTSEKEVQTDLGGNEVGSWEEKLKEKVNQITQLENQVKELGGLKANDTKLIGEQQRKINGLIKIIEKQNEAIERYGNSLYKETYEENGYQNEIVDVSKLK